MVARVVAVVGIVGICFAAGLIARSSLASRLVERLESGVLHSIPGYTFIKGLTGGLEGGDDEGRLAPVLARFDDVSQIGFHVEDLADAFTGLDTADHADDPDPIPPAPVAEEGAS